LRLDQLDQYDHVVLLSQYYLWHQYLLLYLEDLGRLLNLYYLYYLYYLWHLWSLYYQLHLGRLLHLYLLRYLQVLYYLLLQCRL
jgi:hypothetical protein